MIYVYIFKYVHVPCCTSYYWVFQCACVSFCHFAAAPVLPTDVSVEDGVDCYTAVVSWTAPQSTCGVVIGNYNVRYRLKNGGGNYIMVHSPTTSVTLEHLVPYTEYIVSVAAINSAGDIGSFTGSVEFVLQGTYITRVHDKQQTFSYLYKYVHLICPK